MAQPARRGDLPFEVMRLANAVVRELIPVAARFDLTPQQAAILVRLEGFDAPPTLAALGRALSVSKQNITGMVARLVEAGLLRREGDPSDQRASRLTVTRKGAGVVRALRPDIEAFAGAWMEKVGGKDVEDLVTRMIVALG
ncbi:MAG TPA: MarR family transcriptional regulator, partial [Thermoanaerobaculia bacterium]